MRHFAALLLGVALAYLFLALKLCKSWAFFSASFSTHTAVCVALLMYLLRTWHSFTARAAAAGVGFLYALLMLYLGYHAVSHILFTALLMAPCLYGMHSVCLRHKT